MADQYEDYNQSGADEGGSSFASTATRVSETVGNAVENLKGQAQQGIDQLRSAANTARHQGERTYRQVTDQVGQRPMTFMLTALAAGVLLGALFTHLYEGSERY